jgi:hypothetical protein
MTKGYVLISRGLLKHPRFKPSGPLTQFEAWYWLIEAAAYAPRDVTIINGTRGDIITLQPGQLSHSIRFLARAWIWSDKRVQRFLSALRSDQSVTTQTTTGQTVITLCNWDKYQNPFRCDDYAKRYGHDYADDYKEERNKRKGRYSALGKIIFGVVFDLSDKEVSASCKASLCEGNRLGRYH